jgi:AraC-like DNA-binding protein
MNDDKRIYFAQYGDPSFPVHAIPAGPGAINPHSHDFYELVYVRHGGGTNCIENHPYPMLPGDCFLMRPEDTHYYGGAGNFGIVNVLFLPAVFSEPDWQRLLALPGMRAYLEPGRHRAPHKISLVPADARRAEACCDRIIHETRAAPLEPGHQLLARAALTELLVVISRASAAYGGLPTHEQANDDNPVADALTILHRDFREPLSVSVLADAVGLTANWFGERFKATTGLTVHDYLARLRIEAARTALESGDTDITSIALDVGYDDPSYFARIFRRHTGISPRTYRQRVLG